MRRHWLLLAAALVAPAAPAASLHHYRVTVDDTLTRFVVEACFDGPAPAQLVADDGAARFLQHMAVRDAASATVEVGNREATISGAPANACIDYTVQLEPRVRGRQTGGPETRRVDADLLTAFGDWLWRPPVLAGTDDVELTFDLPPGVAVSVPWQRVADSPRPAWRIGATPADWPGVAAFGHFKPVPIDVAGVRVELALVGAASAAQDAFVRGWIERAVRGVATGYGRFPVTSLQVVVVPAGQHGRSPVPWAYVARGGGAAVHLFVDLGRRPQDIEADWSLTHELSHLFLPYVASGDAWLFEGLPSYLQQVLMARNGSISEEEAWRRLYQGFGRGAKVGEGLSLREASERIGRGGLYLRAYWGGAALMLAADLELRQRDPALSLDNALAGLRDCCADTSRRYSAEEILAAMDRATGTSVFSDLAARLVDRPQFPDYDRLFRTLDIDVLGGFPILNDGPGKALREGIMGGETD